MMHGTTNIKCFHFQGAACFSGHLVECAISVFTETTGAWPVITLLGSVLAITVVVYLFFI